ncbi:MAG: tRNA 2-thiouridine(34) synthase MnmA [Bryobacterales bacterium]|jgi:tRNA-specific 2-thiouridylase|nr:tRNA 2-thiouridine(34) synthase MnmA [Bryobacterales bacterium]
MMREKDGIANDNSSRIAVAMSGGVDSSVVAALLHSQGRNIVGMTMQLWNQRRLPEVASEGATGRCCSLDDVYDARYVASQVGIPYYVVNFEDRFEQHVVKPFVQDYLEGKTPIPCTLCNNFIKFDQFLDMAASVGAGMVATGHYARIRQDPHSGRWQLLRAVDDTKDQTYFLFGLTQEQLSRTLFPLGEMRKEDVRELGRQLQVPIADKPDSQEICFVPNGDYAAFIDAYLREQGLEAAATEGQILDEEGKSLGRHRGVHHFTVGQRKGIGVARAEPLYVIATEPSSQTVVVGAGDSLFRKRMRVRDVNWISIAKPEQLLRAQVRIRNRHRPSFADVWVNKSENRVEVLFDDPQRAITPGQGAVFYQDDLVLGGGWIDQALSDEA